jgi:hypothetical protein
MAIFFYMKISILVSRLGYNKPYTFSAKVSVAKTSFAVSFKDNASLGRAIRGKLDSLNADNISFAGFLTAKTRK